MRRGTSLIEVVLVLAMMGIIVGLTMIIGFSTLQRDEQQTRMRNEVYALLRARAQAVTNQCFGSNCTRGMAHGVLFSDRAIVIFQSSPDNPDFAHRTADVDEVIVLSSPVAYQGQTEFVFRPNSGVPVRAGHMRYTSQLGTQLSVDVAQNGRIEW